MCIKTSSRISIVTRTIVRLVSKNIVYFNRSNIIHFSRFWWFTDSTRKLSHKYVNEFNGAKPTNIYNLNNIPHFQSKTNSKHFDSNTILSQVFNYKYPKDEEINSLILPAAAPHLPCTPAQSEHRHLTHPLRISLSVCTQCCPAIAACLRHLAETPSTHGHDDFI